ncbi:tryptophan synthase subunit alpha [filamentous cyanobacterium CCP5]|nr:tryptophan synthase subunit alpha [filamentous cyanobacterium CCP5]
MTSVSERFRDLKARGECALIPFITAGDPDLETTAEALRVLERSGADLIELGVPYSDPLADGPVIQAAATRALKRGVRLEHVLDVVRRVSPELSVPIVLFTYYNPILNRGIESYMAEIAAAGVSGLVVPDLPLEEVETLLAAAAEAGIEVTLLVAPTSPIERIQKIAAQCQGFVYLVSVTGVTGMRTSLQDRVSELLNMIKQGTDKPVGVGFGVSDPEQAQQLKAWGADAVIVGSAFVKRLDQSDRQAGLQALEEFCQSLKAALR